MSSRFSPTRIETRTRGYEATPSDSPAAVRNSTTHDAVTNGGDHGYAALRECVRPYPQHPGFRMVLENLGQSRKKYPIRAKKARGLVSLKRVWSHSRCQGGLGAL
jgi:hypothetical protein